MAHPGVAGSGHRRSMLAGSASLALHGGLLLLVVVTAVDGAGDGRRPGIGTSIGIRVERQGDGIATMQIPQPSAVSLARSPRPRFNPDRLRLHGASKFAGLTIKVVLAVDRSGRVSQVQLVQGVDRDLDRRTVALVHDFELEPALDEVGTAIPATSRWDIQIIEDEDNQPFKTPFGLIHR